MNKTIRQVLSGAWKGMLAGLVIGMVVSNMVTTIQVPAQPQRFRVEGPSDTRRVILLDRNWTNVTITRYDAPPTFMPQDTLKALDLLKVVDALVEMQLVNTNTKGEVMIETLERAMKGIAIVESNGHDIGIHNDGVSWGKHGVTMSAVAQLRKTHCISDEEFMEVQLSPDKMAEPDRNERYCRMYLIDRGVGRNTVDEAVGRYYGGNDKRQRRYIERVAKALAIEDEKQTRKDKATELVPAQPVEEPEEQVIP